MEKVEEDLARSKNLREKQAKEFSRQLDELKIKHEKEVGCSFLCATFFCFAQRARRSFQSNSTRNVHEINSRSIMFVIDRMFSIECYVYRNLLLTIHVLSQIAEINIRNEQEKAQTLRAHQIDRDSTLKQHEQEKVLDFKHSDTKLVNPVFEFVVAVLLCVYHCQLIISFKIFLTTSFWRLSD